MENYQYLKKIHETFMKVELRCSEVNYKELVSSTITLSEKAELLIVFEWPKTLGINEVSTGSTKTFARMDEIWKSECLELFIATSNQNSYYELNFSISEDTWNCYYLSSYRTGLNESDDISLVEKTSSLNNDIYTATFKLTLDNNAQRMFLSENLLINPTAIFQSDEKKQFFWASNHKKGKADFHNKSLFLPFKSLE